MGHLLTQGQGCSSHSLALNLPPHPQIQGGAIVKATTPSSPAQPQQGPSLLCFGSPVPWGDPCPVQAQSWVEVLFCSDSGVSSGSGDQGL